MDEFIHDLPGAPYGNIALHFCFPPGQPGKQALLPGLEAADHIAAELFEGDSDIAYYIFFHDIGGSLFHKPCQGGIRIGTGNAGQFGGFIAGTFSVGEEGQVQIGFLPRLSEMQKFFRNGIDRRLLSGTL